jgi:hypothetical protein
LGADAAGGERPRGTDDDDDLRARRGRRGARAAGTPEPKRGRSEQGRADVAGAATTAGGGGSAAGGHGPELGAGAVAAGPHGCAPPRCPGDRGTVAAWPGWRRTGDEGCGAGNEILLLQSKGFVTLSLTRGPFGGCVRLSPGVSASVAANSK